MQPIKDNNMQAQFGLQKINNILENKNPENTILHFGIDLTNFGLNLNQKEGKLYENFQSPFSDNPTRKVNPHNFKTPKSYQKLTVSMEKYIQKFQIETLMYVFYNIFNKANQTAVCEELLKRDWIYHKKFQRWFKIDDPKEKKTVYEEVKSFDPKIWELQIIKSVELDPKDLLTKHNFDEEIKKSRKSQKSNHS